MSTLILSTDDINMLDSHIESLYEQKPIPEHEVKALCEKVSIPLLFAGKGNYPEGKQRASRQGASHYLR
jgi:hypothetical protein